MLRTILVAVLASRAITAAAVDRKDIEYGNRSGRAMLLDLHIPDGPGPFPAAILIHGGGFDAGSKSTNVRPLFQPLSEAGFAWFSIDYRLAPAAKFPQAMADVNDAITWVKTNAPVYHVDAARIALIGESAGAVLANYAGTHDSSGAGVAAVVDFYGASDYATLSLLRRDHPERFDMLTVNRHAAHGGGIHFFGVDELNEAGVAKLRSLAPITAVHKGMPPFLCIHGTKDDQVSYEQSTAFCDAIRSAGSKCDLISIEGGGHGMSSWKTPEMQHWKPDMIAWLKKTMGLQ